MATKKFSPAQIAAQKLFAERARAGTLGKGKRKAAVKRKANPDNSNKPMAAQGLTSYRYKGRYGFIMIGARDDKDALSEAKRSTRDAVSLENLEVWNGKKYEFVVKRNPEAIPYAMADVEKFHLGGKMYAEIVKKANNSYDYVVYQMYSTGIPGEKPREQFFDSKNYKTKTGAMRGLEKYVQRLGYKINPDKTKPRAYVKRASQATGRPPVKGTKAGNRLITRRKKALSAPAGYFPNPKVKYTNRAKDLKGEQRVGYSVHRADAPSYLAIAWFSKKSDAVQVAQEASDRTGKQLAVTRVQNYFGSM